MWFTMIRSLSSVKMVHRMKIYAFLLVLVAYSVCTSPGSAKIISVPDDFKTIQTAIDAAKAGDTVRVSPGTYKENLEIRKTVALQGAGAEITKLVGGISIEDADNVAIRDFALEAQGRDAHFGIWSSAATVTMERNRVVGYHHGIGSELSKLVISDNSVLRNFNVGIQIENPIEVLVKGNLVSENVDTGIRIALSDGNVSMTENTITANRIGVECVQSKPKLRRNIITGNQVGVRVTQERVPDMGTDANPGLNVIEDNQLQVVNLEHKDSIPAKFNYWGMPSGPDVNSLEGKVDYIPWLRADPRISQPVEIKSLLPSSWGNIRRSVK